MYSATHGLLPSYIINMFQVNSCIHTHDTRQKDKIHQIGHKLNLRKFAAQTWRRGDHNSKKYTLRLLAFNPFSVGVIASEVVADSRVDGAIVEQFTVQSVRHRTALRRNRCGVVAFIQTALHFNQPVILPLDHCDLQRKMGVNNLPKVVIRQRCGRESNSQLDGCEFNCPTPL